MPNPYYPQTNSYLRETALENLARQQAEARNRQADLLQLQQQREQTVIPLTGTNSTTSRGGPRAWRQAAVWERSMQTGQERQALRYSPQELSQIREVSTRTTRTQQDTWYSSRWVPDEFSIFSRPSGGEPWKELSYTSNTSNYEIGDWVEWTIYGKTYKGKILSMTSYTMRVSWDSNFLKDHNLKIHEVSLSSESIHKIKTPTQKELVQEKINKLWKESNYVKQNKQLIY